MTRKHEPPQCSLDLGVTAEKAWRAMSPLAPGVMVIVVARAQCGCLTVSSNLASHDEEAIALALTAAEISGRKPDVTTFRDADATAKVGNA